MKLHIFTVYDSKAQAYLPPFFLPNTAIATRTFTNAANDKGHAFGANPADYTLFHVGHFDDDTAKIVSKATPHPIGLAQDFVLPSDQLEMFDRLQKAPEKGNSETQPQDQI